MTLTFGVEEEFMLVGTDGRLRDANDAVLATAAPPAGEFEPELVRCQVESVSPVCDDGDELLWHLRTQRDQLGKAAEQHDLRLLPIGCAPQAYTASVTPRERYRQMADHFGALIDNANTCGCHVHVGIPDAEAGVHVINHLRPWLPLLLAVSANSVYVQGKDSGYASWRHRMMTMWPAAGPPPYFESVADYRATVDDALQTGAITDERMIYWDIRLSARHPTVEVRVCDVAPTARDATMIAMVIRGLVGRALDEDRPAPRISGDTLRAGLWRAGRGGLAGECPDPVDGEPKPVGRLLDRLVEVAGGGEQVASWVGGLRATGGPAGRQRAAFARAGRVSDVVTCLAGR